MRVAISGKAKALLASALLLLTTGQALAGATQIKRIVTSNPYEIRELEIDNGRVYVGLPDYQPAEAGVEVYDLNGNYVRTYNNAYTTGMSYGYALDSEDGYLVVGATYSATPGRAYVYNSNTGQYLRTLTPSDCKNHDLFGNSIAVSGNRAVVGAMFHDLPDGWNDGAAYLFDLTTGQQLRKFSVTPGYTAQEFGQDVVMNDDYIVISELWGGNHGGSMRVYDTQTGTLLNTIYNDSGQDNAMFGKEMALVGNRVLAGAQQDEAGVPGGGSASLYDASTGQKLMHFTGHTPYERLGVDVAMTDKYIALGAYGYRTGGSNNGAVYIYDAQTGIELERIEAPADAGYQFGRTIAMEGDRLIVSGYTTGAAYLYQLDDTWADYHNLYWDQPVNGSWSLASNWRDHNGQARSPGSLSYVKFDHDAAYTVAVGGGAAAKSMDVTAGDVTLALNGNSLDIERGVNAAGALTLTNGTVTIGDYVVSTGPGLTLDGATIDAGGLVADGLTMLNGAGVQATGSVTLTGSTIVPAGGYVHAGEDIELSNGSLTVHGEVSTTRSVSVDGDLLVEGAANVTASSVYVNAIYDPETDDYTDGGMMTVRNGGRLQTNSFQASGLDIDGVGSSVGFSYGNLYGAAALVSNGAQFTGQTLSIGEGSVLTVHGAGSILECSQDLRVYGMEGYEDPAMNSTVEVRDGAMAQVERLTLRGEVDVASGALDGWGEAIVGGAGASLTIAQPLTVDYAGRLIIEDGGTVDVTGLDIRVSSYPQYTPSGAAVVHAGGRLRWNQTQPYDLETLPELLDVQGGSLDFVAGSFLGEQGDLVPSAELLMNGRIEGALEHYGAALGSPAEPTALLELAGQVKGDGDLVGNVLISGTYEVGYRDVFDNPRYVEVEAENLAFADDSVLKVDWEMWRIDEDTVGAFRDIVNVSGLAELDGQMKVDLTGRLYPGSYLLLRADTYVGRFDSMQLTYPYFADDPEFRSEIVYGELGVWLEVSVVPEPATAALLCGGMLFLAGRRAVRA